MGARSIDRAERLLDLVSLFLAASGRPVSWDHIQEAFPGDYATGSLAAARRKFERDKAELLELGIPLEYLQPLPGRPGGYVLPAEEYFLRDLKLLPDEAALLSMAGAAALQQPGFPFHSDLAHALGKLLFQGGGGAPSLAHLAPQGRRAGLKKADDDPGPAVPPSRKGPPIQHERQLVLDALGRAVAGRKNVLLRYRSAGGVETERTVSPWGLAFRKGAWFLVGRCHLRQALRTFQAERIRGLEILAGRGPDFEVPNGFDPAGLVGREPWEFGVHEPLAASLLMDAPIALVARSRFGEGASVTEAGEGAVLVALEVSHGEALTREILRLGPNAELVAPGSLRSTVEATALALAGLHEGEGVAGAVAPVDPDAAEGPEVAGVPSGRALEVQERLRRALFLIPWAVRNRGCTVEELAAAARIPQEEVLSEIEFLRMVGRPPFSPADMVDIDVIDGRVEICLPQGLLRPPALTPLEAAALDAAASAFESEGGDLLRAARQKLRDTIPPLARSRFDDVAGRVKVAAMGLDPAVAKLVDLAIAQRKELHFTYWTAARGEASRRTVRPLERLLHQGYWYLHAFCCTNRERRLFRLDRAVDFEMGEKGFVPRAVDDAARFQRETLYAPSARARHCTLRLNGPNAEELGRRIGAEAMGRDGEGRWLVSLPVDGAAYVVSLVMSLAGSAELVEPVDLRARIHEVAKAVALRHG